MIVPPCWILFMLLAVHVSFLHVVILSHCIILPRGHVYSWFQVCADRDVWSDEGRGRTSSRWKPSTLAWSWRSCRTSKIKFCATSDCTQRTAGSCLHRGALSERLVSLAHLTFKAGAVHVPFIVFSHSLFNLNHLKSRISALNVLCLRFVSV
jgi:hypothetical protein